MNASSYSRMHGIVLDNAHKILVVLLPLELKQKFFSATVMSVLLYGCETWSVTATMEKRTNGAFTKLLRYASNIRWQDIITNAVVYRGFEFNNLAAQVRKRRVRFAGHWMRATYQPVCHLVLKEPTSYIRGKGNTRTYTKTILADIRLYVPNAELVDIIELASDRIQWKKVVEQIYSRTKYISNNLI